MLFLIAVVVRWSLFLFYDHDAILPFCLLLLFRSIARSINPAWERSPQMTR